MSRANALGVSSLISGLCFRFLFVFRVVFRSVVKIPFSLAALETERGFAIEVGGRSRLLEEKVSGGLGIWGGGTYVSLSARPLRVCLCGILEVVVVVVWRRGSDDCCDRDLAVSFFCKSWVEGLAAFPTRCKI